MIIRAIKDKNYSVINNTVLRDSRLSWRARGLAAYILTQPDEWSINSTHLWKQGIEGRDAVRKCLVELREAGYLKRLKYQKPNGQWATELHLTEIPTPENQSSENQSSENQSLILSTNKTSTNKRKTKKQDTKVDDDAFAFLVSEDRRDVRSGRADQAAMQALRNHVESHVIAATGAAWDDRKSWIAAADLPRLRATLQWCEVARSRMDRDPDAIDDPVGFIRAGVERNRAPGLRDNQIEAIDTTIALIFEISESEYTQS